MCPVPQFLKAPLDAHLRLTAGLAGRRRIPQGPLRVAPLAGPNFCASAASAPLPSVLRRGREPGPSATSAGLRRTRRSGVCIPREASGGRVRQRQPPSQKVEPAQTHPRTSGRAKRSPAAGTDRKGNAAQAEAAATESHAGRGAVPAAGRAVSDALLWSPQLSPAPQLHPSSLRPTRSGAPLQATCPRWKASPWPPGVPAPGLPGPPPLRVASPPTGGHPSLAFG